MNKKTQRILDLLAAGIVSTKELAQKTGIKKGSVSKMLQRLAKKGIIEGIGRTTNRYYQLRTKDVQSDQNVQSVCPQIPHIVGDQNVQSSSKDEKKRQWLHNLRRKYKLNRRIRPQGQVYLHNTTQERFRMQGISCILTSRHLIVEGVQEWGELTEPAPELLKRAEKKADAIASQALRNRLPTLKLEHGITTHHEIAICDIDEARRLAEQNKGKISLYKDENGELYVDRTPNPAAFEGSGLKPLPDGDQNKALIIERWRQLAKPVEEGRWSAETQLALNQSIIEGEHKRAEWELKFMKSHNDIVKEATKLIKQLREERKQRRL